MNFHTFRGNPEEMGKAYGKTFMDLIQKNLSILVLREGYDPLPRDDPEFISYMKTQEKIITENWPWLIKTMEGIAAGAKQRYKDILYLNLRVWQYKLYSGKTTKGCSSMVISLCDGTIASAGALDDAKEYYCGLIKFVPVNGCRFFSFPIAGTIWGTRGINSAGLTLGSSSQVLPGIRRVPNTINQDLAQAVILQTCSTVDEVRQFCRRFPFNINLVCTDSGGNVFCAHHTSNGLFEVTDKPPYVMTNHIISDRLMFIFKRHGVISFPESSTTRLRRGKLLDFINNYEGKCSAEDVRRIIADRAEGALTSICPEHNIVVTYANPQAEPGIFWVADPQTSKAEEWSPLTL